MSSQDTAVPEAAFFQAIRRWGVVRGPEGVLGGVISGAGARVGLAPWPSRLIVIAAGLFLFPVVMLAYAFGWAVLPDAEGRIVIQDFGRGVTNVGALIGIAIFAIVGFVSFSDVRPWGRDNWIGPNIGAFDGSVLLRTAAIIMAVIVPLVILAAVVGLVVVLSRRSGSTNSATGGQAPPPVYALTPEQARSAATGGASSGTASRSSAPAEGVRPAPAATPQTPPAPPTPPRPRVPRVPGPGVGFSLTVLAWAFIAAAGTAWASREGILATYAPLAWSMVFMTGLGVILILVSLSGRKLGFLGFLGGLGMLPALVLLAWHPQLLDSYADDRRGIEFTVTEVFEVPQSIDATPLFADEYQNVFFAGSCWSEEDVEVDTSGGTARITVPAPVEEDAAFSIRASATTVVIPQGTSLRVVSDGWAQATVHFADRDLTCDYPGAEGDYVTLINPGEPVITLTVHDDAYANTIVIEEKS